MVCMERGPSFQASSCLDEQPAGKESSLYVALCRCSCAAVHVHVHVCNPMHLPAGLQRKSNKQQVHYLNVRRSIQNTHISATTKRQPSTSMLMQASLWWGRSGAQVEVTRPTHEEDRS